MKPTERPFTTPLKIRFIEIKGRQGDPVLTIQHENEEDEFILFN